MSGGATAPEAGKTIIPPQGGSGTAPAQSALTETELKANKLRGYFPPVSIVWAFPDILFTQVGQLTDCVPMLAADAIRERLDRVLLPDNWRERYEHPNAEYTRCILECRYTLGGDWVSRVGLSNQDDLEVASNVSFRAAALSYGIGRYLKHCVQAVPVVEDAAKHKHPKTEPQLPQHVLPHDWQYVSRETARKLRDLVSQAAAESTERKAIVTAKDAIAAIAGKYGIKTLPDGDVNLATLLNYQCTQAMQWVKDWLEDIANGRLASDNCPVKPKMAA